MWIYIYINIYINKVIKNIKYNIVRASDSGDILLIVKSEVALLPLQWESRASPGGPALALERTSPITQMLWEPPKHPGKSLPAARM